MPNLGIPDDFTTGDVDVVEYLVSNKHMKPEEAAEIVGGWKASGVLDKGVTPDLIDKYLKEQLTDRFTPKNVDLSMRAEPNYLSYQSNEVEDTFNNLLHEYNATTNPDEKYKIKQKLDHLRRLKINGSKKRSMLRKAKQLM